MEIDATSYNFIMNFGSPIIARNLRIVVSERLYISNFLMDPGNGYKPFYPLSIKLNNVKTDIPFSLDAGTHTIRFIGEIFEGIALQIIGINLNAITDANFKGDAEL